MQREAKRLKEDTPSVHETSLPPLIDSAPTLEHNPISLIASQGLKDALPNVMAFLDSRTDWPETALSSSCFRNALETLCKGQLKELTDKCSINKTFHERIRDPAGFRDS